MKEFLIRPIYNKLGGLMQLKAIIPMVAIFMLSGCEDTSKRKKLATLRGTWTVVSAKLKNDNGVETNFYGENPNGILVFDKQGYYSLIVFDGDSLSVPFLVNDREKGTDLENRRVVHGSIASFGKYDILDGKQGHSDSLELVIKYATFPNWKGLRQRRRLLSLSNDTLMYEVKPASSKGALLRGYAIFVWSKKTY
jgi:hypothetical protein